MAKNFKRMLSTLLALVLSLSTLTPVLAVEEAWHEDVNLNVKSGTDGYTYMLFGDLPNYFYYETSNHTLKKEVTGGGAVHLIALIDTFAKNGEWTPSGIYEYGKSNYDVVYCCDAATGSEAGDYYKRLNLEDSEYFTDTEAKMLRAILTNSYPYLTVEEAKAALKEAGFAQADDLDRSELITATQAAVWSIANKDNGDSFVYNKTATTAQKDTWGGYLHDFSSEITNFTDSITSRKYLNNPNGVGDRINALREFLLAMEPVKAEDNQIVITDIKMVDREHIENGSSNVTLNIELNHAVSAEDNISIYALVNNIAYAGNEITEGSSTGTINVKNISIGDEIKVVVSGTQKLEKGVYFYAPKPEDVDGDGKITAREVSQNLIGVGAGETPVYAEKTYRIKTDKTAEPLDEEYNTNVTLTVSNKKVVENEEAVDIVIALGAGIACEQNTVESIHTLVEPLFGANINVKLGLIAVEHYDDVAMELTEINADNYKDVIANGLNTIINMPAGPTNLHGNIVAAKAMLDADTEVEAENKYFYVIGTGRTYNFDNEDGVPTTIINTVDLKGSTYYYWGHYLWQSQRGQHTSLYRVPTAYNNDFAAYWADIEKWVKADGNTYAYSFTDAYNVNEPEWFNNFYVENSTDAKALGLASSRYGWILPDLTNSSRPAIGSGVLPQNALNYERAQYEAYYAYKAMVDAGYKCQTLCSESVSYQNYSPYMTVQNATPSIQLGHSFMDYMAKLSSQEESTVLFNLLDNNGNYKMAENFFTPIELTGEAASVEEINEIEKGTFVEDYIGFDADETEGYDYDFITDAELILTVNGTEYNGNMIEKSDDNAMASYVFGDIKNPIAKVEYVKGNGTTEEHFVWTFLENVAGPASLKYRLVLAEKSDIPGDHTTETNQYAKLKTPDGDVQIFPVPKVDYNVPKKTVPPTITFKSGEASNISFMLIDKATGKVEFLEKIDIGNKTSFEIPTEEGKISAVFVKQSTSGMFWASEKIDETTQKAVIACLKANNPSCKGHWAEFFFGDGNCTWEFKKNKSVTYTFSGGEGILEESVTTPIVKEEVVEEESKVEEVKPEEEVKESSDKKADKKAEKEAEKAAKKNNKKK